MMPVENRHQLDTLRLYGTLIGQCEEWGGKLVLCCGSGCASSGIPPAVSIAGGATLAIDGNATAIKAAMRAGEVDFIVNSLDEALRTLKNEIRKKRPLSVGLIAEYESGLAEIVERGVLPDLFLTGFDQEVQPILQNPQMRALKALGMPVRLPVQADELRLGVPFVILAGERYFETYIPASNSAELRDLDQRLRSLFSSRDLVRGRWIQRVPQYVREARSGGRWIWLSEAEKLTLGL